MPVFEGEVIMRYAYVVTADGEDNAEYDMLAMAKEDFPYATGFVVNNIVKVTNDT